MSKRKLRILSGTQLIKAFAHEGFVVVSQRGSHVKLQRTHATTNQTLTIPRHAQISIGTAREILKHAQQYIPHDVLDHIFYTARKK